MPFIDFMDWMHILYTLFFRTMTPHAAVLRGRVDNHGLIEHK